MFSRTHLIRSTFKATPQWVLSVFLGLALVIGTNSTYALDTVTYYHLDALGSPVVATDEQGNVKWREDYRPYGSRLRNEAASQDNTRYHTGHSQDNDTGLVYAGARFYDPVLGRFMAKDPQGFKQSNIQSFNQYTYGNNNPYKYVDPDGESALAVLIVGVAVIGLAIYELSQPVAVDEHGDAGLQNLDIAPPALKGASIALGTLKRVGKEVAKKLAKPSLSAHKKALKKVHEKVGKLPKGKPGKFGSPQAGNSKKGYRLDPPHKSAKKGSSESQSHINWWDYTGGKRGKGGMGGTIPIKD